MRSTTPPGRRGPGARVAAADFPTAASLLPWRATKISVQPFGRDWWSFNPSVHHDRATGLWRCVYRIANYSLPDGVIQMSPTTSTMGRARTRNVVAELDPETLEPTSAVTEMLELDGAPRAPTCQSLGYEDMRLFSTARDGLCAVATALQLNLQHPNRPEVTLCYLDDDYAVVRAVPIRGPWSCQPQKNWSPFDGTDEPTFLYSIERGVVMTDDGVARGSPPPTSPPVDRTPRQGARKPGGAEVRVVPRAVQIRPEPKRAPGSDQLRGGGQLVEVAPGCWLSIAHEMTLTPVDRKKLYWHVFYTVDDDGRMTARSQPFKLSGDHGIEFAAGLAVDEHGRVAVSYGTDDHDAWIATTELSAVLGLLRPVSDVADDPTLDMPALPRTPTATLPRPRRDVVAPATVPTPARTPATDPGIATRQRRWTGPREADLVDGVGDRLVAAVPQDRWPYGPATNHERVCRLHRRGLFCDCLASGLSDDEHGEPA